MSRQKKLNATVEAPPEFARSAKVFGRARRLAASLLGVPENYAEIVLLRGANAWLSSNGDNPLPADAPLCRQAIEAGGVVWVENLADNPDVGRVAAAHGGSRARFLACAPIRIDDGSYPGALIIGDRKVRSYDARIAASLQDIADMVADEWVRTRATQERELTRRERDEAYGTLASVVEATPTPLVVTDRRLRILQASPFWLEGRGLTASEAIGRSLYDVLPDVPLRWRQIFDRCLAGETIAVDDVRSMGRKRTNARACPWRDATGDVGGLVLVSHDITELMEALDHTARSEDRLKVAMELAMAAVWDHDFTAEDATPSYRRLTEGVWGVIDPADEAAVEAEWRRFLTEGAAFAPEYRLDCGGETIWVAGAARLIRDAAGKPQRVVGAVQNISARKAQERALIEARDEAQSANRAKSAFLATISHEIRTPLNGLMGMVEVMSRGELDAKQRGRLDVIRSSSDGLLTILNELLDLSKIEAGKLTLENGEFDLMELAEEACATFRAVAENKGVELGLQVSSAARGAYCGDAMRLRQILHNLVSNALKFTERGAVRIRVGRRGGKLQMTVSDTGIGMSAEQQDRLFRAFQQAEASTTRRFGGTGLGLSICRQLVEAMGGRITVTSAPGEGSSFTVSLPLRKIEAAAAPKALAPAPALAGLAQLSGPPLRVLAAEDNSVNQLVLTTLLSQVDIEPTMVGDGRAAVDAWAAEPWDLILMDVQMPRLDGPSATLEIRAREAREGRARTPIVALTANAMEEQIAEYLAVGMDGFVAKPITASRLFAAIEAALAAPLAPGAEEAA